MRHETLTLKALAMGLIFGISLFGSAAAFWLRRSTGWDNVEAMGNVFAGGLLLAAALLHMLPESVENTTLHTDYPVAYLLCGTTFGLGIMCELIWTSYSGALSRVHDEGESAEPCLPASPSTSSLVAQKRAIAERYGPHYHGHNDPQSALIESISRGARRGIVAVLLVALVFHSVLMGMALGLEDKPSSSVGLIVALMAHKGLESYALAQSCLSAHLSFRVSVVILLGFSLASPAGIGVGMALSKKENSNVLALLQALAAGLLLYLGAIHFPKHGDTNTAARWMAPTFFMGGFACMAVLAIWA